MDHPSEDFFQVSNRLTRSQSPTLQLTSQSRSASFSLHHATTAECDNVDKVIFDMLPDDILLELFHIYLNGDKMTQGWHTLIHVCRRWRYIIFASPRVLDLRLLCTISTPVKARLAIWPAFPIAIIGRVDSTSLEVVADNIIAALEHKDRVWRIDLQCIPNSLMGRIAAAMGEPFPLLTDLSLHAMAPVLPDSFLGGSVPGLQSLRLTSVPFPALRKFLPTAIHLVFLELWDVPHSGYISPSVMATCLSALARLEELQLGFRSPQSRPDRANQRPPSQTRLILPALSRLQFKGVGEYLEDLVGQIGAPLLNDIWIVFFHQLIFDTPQLRRFLSRTNGFKVHARVNVHFCGDFVRVSLYSQTYTSSSREVTLLIKCKDIDWQLSSVAQLCRSSLPSLSTVQHLNLYGGPFRPHPLDNLEVTQWLELLQPFTAVKTLYICDKLAPNVAPALQTFLRAEEADVLLALE